MIDLHCHILPGVDDGAGDRDVALAMARAAVADGITVTACTPHFLPGVYDNDGPAMRAATAALQRDVAAAGIPLRLTTGGDVHLAPGMLDDLRRGRSLTLADSRYFLIEPPKHTAPPQLERALFDAVAHGFVPIVTHPERLAWIDGAYAMMAELVRGGAWIQLTAGSLTGQFGHRCRERAVRMLEDGLVHILATDSHNIDKRPPKLSLAARAAADLVGEEEARHLVQTRPKGILDNMAPGALPAPPEPTPRRRASGILGRLLSRR